MKYSWEVVPNMYVGDDSYKRFVLGVSGNHPLICLGVNPSTANNEYADKTLHMVEQIAKRNDDYDSWMMLNIYPYRATDPKNLPKIRNDALHNENLCYIKTYLQKTYLQKIYLQKTKTNVTIWAAWGDPIMERNYLRKCLHDIYNIAKAYSCRFIAFGREENGEILSTTKHGNPRHPSRLPLSAKPKCFELTHYFPK